MTKPPNSTDAPPPNVIREMTGLEIMQGILSGDAPPAPISHLIGYRLVEVEKGRVVFEGAPREALYNPMGTVHGGWYGILLDSCMGCAVHTMMPAGKTYTTLEYKVNILRAARAETGALRAEGRCIHAGRRTATAERRMIDGDGKVYATATTTCLVLEY